MSKFSEAVDESPYAPILKGLVKKQTMFEEIVTGNRPNESGKTIHEIMQELADRNEANRGDYTEGVFSDVAGSRSDQDINRLPQPASAPTILTANRKTKKIKTQAYGAV